MYPVILCGDFNYPHINWLTNTFPTNLDSYRHIIDFFSLTQHVYEPTRANAVLDLIFSNPSELISSVSLLEPLHNSDHAVLEADINLPIRVTPPQDDSVRWFRNFKSIDWIKFSFILQNLSWDAIRLQDNVADQWLVFKANVVHALDCLAPLTASTIRSRSGKKGPWYNITIKNIRADKRRAWENYRSCRSEVALQAFHHQRNRLTTAIRNARDLFEMNVAEQLSTNHKLFFQYANSQNKVKAQLPYLKLSDGRCTQNMIESANELNAYFVSVFSESSRITETTTNINIVENPLYSLYKFNTEQVRLRLLSLNNRKAAGPDGISNTILKQNSYALAPHLTVLFQHSLDKGIVPDEWKDANVTPIHKSGATDVAANYRPISLMSCVCKVMERFVYDWLSTYLR